VQIEIGPVEHQLARLDLRKIEHILDQPQHHPAGSPQRLQHVRLLASKRSVAQQIRHADDGIQGRAHLVADHGDKAAFSLVCRFGARQRIEHTFH
jgi:hypothetical protein